MKAALITKFGLPDVFSVDEIPTPVPGPGEALVRIKACGVNRMDTELRAGVYGGEPLDSFFFGRNIALPHLPGIEPAGIVEAVGEGVIDLIPGTFVIPHSHLSCGSCANCAAGDDNACPEIRVLGVQTPGQGGYAEYIVWPASQLITFKNSLSFVSAAALLVNYGPIWNGLIERASLREQDTLVVTGAAGGCGHAALDIGRLTGCRTIAVTRSAHKADALITAGATEVIIDRGDETWAEEVLRLTDGRGADCVLELVGAATWQQSLAAAASRGRVVVIGSHSGLNVELNLAQLFSKNLTIIGITRANRRSMEQVVRNAETGLLRPSIGHSIALDNVSEAHRLMDSDSHTGKIVLTMD
ncbi:MAG: NADPH:quinone reductase-like Zn-dependent oxidoreductase [Gammaproteobacteria bacterium]|jgi:NADPH:quinone reductase-like Zn-dependent oxidoreductase